MIEDAPVFPKRILHADDDPMIREIVERALKGLGDVEIESVLSGEKFIEKAASFRPDLIMIDLKMPGIDGLDAIEAIRKLNPPVEAPVIFFTGFCDIVMQDFYEVLGVIGVLHKPLSPGLIPERIRYMWAEHHGLPTNIEASRML